MWLTNRGGGAVEPAADITVTTEASEATRDLTLAESTALAILEARRNFDFETAMRLLDDAAVVDLGPADSMEAMTLELQWTEASGMAVTPEACEAEGTEGTASVLVHSAALATNPIAELSDREPLTFEYEVNVGNGVITSIELVDIGEYSTVVWESFEQWVRTDRPDAHATMYGDAEGTSDALSDDSIDLWREYTTEFVKKKTFAEAFANSEAYLEARCEGDVEAAVSYSAQDALLDWGAGTAPDELAMALAWESASASRSSRAHASSVRLVGGRNR